MALAATTHSAPTYSNINLVPLRVNVVSDDHTLSVVETLVLDRYCWPVPLFEPLEEAMDQNAEELAYMLLSDLEVHGMGRTVRHFTGRVDLWTVSLHQKIKAQLIPQLRHVAKTTKLRIVKRDQKRKSEDSDDKKKSTRDSKEAEPSSSSDTATKPTTIVSKEEEDPPAAPPKKKKKKASLVPVRLRLCVNGIRIHDDFIWDLNVPQCPIEFATSLGDDLNLPSEAIAAIVTSIVEQLDGSTVDDTKDLDSTTNSSGRKNATAAWALDHRVHISNMQHLLTMHRPTTTSISTSTSAHHVQTYGSG